MRTLEKMYRIVSEGDIEGVEREAKKMKRLTKCNENWTCLEERRSLDLRTLEEDVQKSV